MPSWQIEHLTGDVAEFHARALPADARRATFFRAESATLVLGSSQRLESVDSHAAARQGIDVVRRRSGGGGVLLLPGEFVWFDLVIPATDPLWSDDIGRSMWWVGELWRAALATFEPLATVHRGPMLRTQWSPDVCFAGIGPGEVLRAGAKLVGISQRRTRQAARFQTMIHLRWRPDVVASLVAGSSSVTEFASLVATCSAAVDDITGELTAALTQLDNPQRL
jgi:lipoate-protein ligase A